MRATSGRMAGPYRLSRTLIRVGGAEARPFLHNLLTQNVETLAAPAYAGLLSPQGKVIADMILWPREDGVILEADPLRGPDLLRRLMMFRLRSPVQIEDVSDAFTIVVSAAPLEAGAPDPRLAALGWRTLVEANVAPSAEDTGYSARRIALGVPDLAVDVAAEEVFALEALFEELNGVDFHKGCFVGQENVSRMKRRATTRKKFCPITFDGPPPPFGAAILAGEAEIGTVRSRIEGRAIALVRLDRAGEAPLSVGGRPVRLDPPDWLILPDAEAS
ncbi:MAG: folate-binding protein [Pseudomonadota bacterium]